MPTTRKGEAPSLEPFIGVGADILFDQWLPSLKELQFGMAGVKLRS